MPAHLIAEEGPLRGLIIDFEDGDEWIIGRDPDQADFVLEDSTVSRKHVLCSRTAKGIQIKNLSKVNACTINDEEIKGAHLLKEGDEVRIGQNLFIFSEEEAKPAKKEAPDTAFDAIFEEDENEELPPIGEAADEEEETPLSEEEEEPEEEEPEEEISEEVSEPEEEKTAYDTIFEDAEEYEELPFNLIGESSLILKVIAGPNAGAEIGIQKGRSYIIGKDANSSDIVFQDLSVSRNHSRLTVSGDGKIELEDLGSKNGTLVNGLPVEGKKEVTGQDLIALGTTTFLIIDREMEAETIYAPSAATYEERVEVPRAKEEEAEEKEKVPAKEKLPWKKQLIPMKHLVFAGSFVVIFFVVFLSFFSLFKAERYVASPKDHMNQIKDVLENYTDVVTTFSPSSGKLFMVGHVLTPVRHEELLYQIEQLPFIESVEDNIVIDEYVSKSMNDVLTENAGFRSVNVHSPKAGSFIVSGYLQSPQQAEELSSYLNASFPFLDRLENMVVVESELNSQVAGIIQAKGFAGLTLQITNGMVVLGGRYFEKDLSAYKALMKELKSVKGVRGVKDFAVASSAESSRIDLTKNYTVTGFAEHDNMNFSVVVNGQIVTLGERLDGMMITKITPGAILLEKDGLKYKIDYSR